VSIVTSDSMFEFERIKCNLFLDFSQCFSVFQRDQWIRCSFQIAKVVIFFS
jgi:hypothetical protein